MDLENSADFFVLSNGIFTTGGYGTKESYAKVRHIPVNGARLDKVVAVNQLSREIEEGKYPSLDMILSQFTDEKHELNRNDILETIEFTKIAGYMLDYKNCI